MRRILRKIAEDEFGNLGDTSTLADPAVVDDLVNNRQNQEQRERVIQASATACGRERELLHPNHTRRKISENFTLLPRRC